MSLKLRKEPEALYGPLALIDGDMIAYACASAADGSKWRVILPKFGHQDFKYKKDAVAWIKELPQDVGEKVHIEQVYEPDPIEWALHSVNEMLISILQTLNTNQYRIFISDNKHNNFRYKVYPEYKANRKDTRIPEHLNACKEHLHKKWKATLAAGMEADDALGIMQYEDYSKAMSYVINKADLPLVKNPWTKTVICTRDKDLNMIPGWHYDWYKDEKFWVSELEAIRLFYIQMITGDRTDNIEGLSEKKPKKRTYKTKPIEEMEDENEMADYVLCGYLLKYPEEIAYKQYLLNKELLWIRRE